MEGESWTRQLLRFDCSHFQAVFLVFGSVTFAWGIAVYFLLPDAPSTAWFLSKEDRTKAVLRVKGNMTGMKSHKWKPYQMVEALTDPKTWFIVLFQLSMNIPNGGITSVRPPIFRF